MSYYNVDIPQDSSCEKAYLTRLEHMKLLAELDYYKSKEKQIIEIFENVLDSIDDRGFVEITRDEKVYRLVMDLRDNERE